MSLLDLFKEGALETLHTTANQLHAQLANTLKQAGHDVSEDDTTDKLVEVAQTVASGTAKQPSANTVAPNYADIALATFAQSMTAALVHFGQQHLPLKFQPAAAVAASSVQEVFEDGKVSLGESIEAAANVASAAISAAVPAAAPLANIGAALVDALIPDEPKAPTINSPKRED